MICSTEPLCCGLSGRDLPYDFKNIDPMSVRCDVCGIEELESQEFAQERLPFCRLKRYCPACHKRLYHRVYLLLALAPLFLETIGLVEVLRGSKSFLQGTGMWFACLVARFFWTEVHVLAIWSSS